jgi:ABC-type transport system involved in Fe-S cluster assembly fused permease/ATPase subunit
MVQTSYYMVQETTSGARMILQAGRHAFTTTGKSATLTIGVTRIVAGHAVIGTNALANKWSSILSLPMLPGTMLTQHLNKIVFIARKTGTISGMGFDYELFGW